MKGLRGLTTRLGFFTDPAAELQKLDQIIHGKQEPEVLKEGLVTLSYLARQTESDGPTDNPVILVQAVQRRKCSVLGYQPYGETAVSLAVAGTDSTFSCVYDHHQERFDVVSAAPSTTERGTYLSGDQMDAMFKAWVKDAAPGVAEIIEPSADRDSRVAVRADRQGRSHTPGWGGPRVIGWF